MVRVIPVETVRLHRKRAYHRKYLSRMKQRDLAVVLIYLNGELETTQIFCIEKSSLICYIFSSGESPGYPLVDEVVPKCGYGNTEKVRDKFG